MLDQVQRVSASLDVLNRLAKDLGNLPGNVCTPAYLANRAQELAKVEPNMRNKMDCPRERAAVLVELDMDGKPLYRVSTPPLGLRKDGAATVYRRLAIPAGAHQFSARMADGPEGAINYSRSLSVDLAPGQVLIIDFLTGSGGFVFTHS